MEQYILDSIKKYTVQTIIEDNKLFYEEITKNIKNNFNANNLTDVDIYNIIHNIKSELFGEEHIHSSIFRNRAQVEKLKKTIQYEQRTPIWYKVRKNLITATNVAGIVGSSKYDKLKDLIKKKVESKQTFISSMATDHGKCYEDVAIQMYERRTKTKIHEFGLLIHDTIPFLGASPDGITDDGIMVEIKCPVSRVINGNVYDLKTTCYFIQMQTQLEVCNLDICDFLECQIIDYDSKKDFYDDTDSEFFGSNNLEKGVVGAMEDKLTKEKIFFIPDFDLSVKDKVLEIKRWHKKNKESYNKLKNKYWNLKLYSVTRVKRDKEFFRKIKPTLYKFWDEVLELREDPKLYEEKYSFSRSNSNLKKQPQGQIMGFSLEDLK